LGDVVEATVPHRGDVAQAALHLVGHGQRRQELPAVPVGAHRGGKHRTRAVARVARFASGDVGVVEVEVAHQGAIVEGHPVRRGPPAADEGGVATAAEILDVLPDHPDRFPVERADGAAEAVQHPELELLPSRHREIVPGGPHHEGRQLLSVGHAALREAG
jgi:hypothetical protein